MKALLYSKDRTIKYVTVANPKLINNESLIKVYATGICGSDIHAYHGLDKVKKSPPLILGHEVSGINESNNRPVVLNPIIACRKCKNCRSKKENLCINLSMIGMSKPLKRQGGFAEFLSIPKSNIYNIPDKKHLFTSAITEPTAVSLHAVNLCLSHFKKKINQSNILIIGAGSIGLLTAIILQNKNAKKITMIDINLNRLKECKKYSDLTIAHPNNKKILNKKFDIIFDAVGSKQTRKKCLDSICHGGLIIHIGLAQNSGGLDFLELTRKEITFIGSYAYSNKEFKKSLSMILNREIGDLSWLDFCPLKDGESIFKSIVKGNIKAPKTILIP